MTLNELTSLIENSPHAKAIFPFKQSEFLAPLPNIKYEEFFEKAAPANLFTNNSSEAKEIFTNKLETVLENIRLIKEEKSFQFSYHHNEYECKNTPVFNKNGEINYVLQSISPIQKNNLTPCFLPEKLLLTIPGITYRYRLNKKWDLSFVHHNLKSLKNLNENDLQNSPKSFLRKVHPEDLPKVFNAFRSNNSTKKINFRCRVNTNNATIWLAHKGVITEKPNNKKIVEGFIEDITEKVELQQEIKKLNSRYALAQQATNDAIWDYDLAENKITWGEGYHKLFGYLYATKRYSNVNLHKQTNIHPEDREEVCDNLRKRILDKNVSEWVSEYRYLKADNSVAFVRNRCHISRDKNRNATRIVGALQDITSEKNREKQKELIIKVNKILEGSTHLKEGLEKLLKMIQLSFNISYSEIWLTSIDDTKLNFISNISEEKASIKKKSFVKNEHILNEVWKANKRKYFSSQDLNHTNLDKYENFNGVVIPLSISEKVIGVLLLASNLAKSELQQVANIIKEIHHEVAIIIDRKKKQEEFNTFFNISNDSLCIAGLDGFFKKVNPAFLKTLGYTEDEILSRPIHEFVHPEDLTLLNTELQNLAKGIPTYQHIIRYIHKDGFTVWLNWTASSQPEEDLIYAIGKNITENKKAELKLIEANQKLRETQTIAKLGYWKRSLSSEISFWSAEVYQIYEQDLAKFIPTLKNLLSIFHPDDRYLLKEELTNILIKNEYKDFEHRIVTPSGKEKWVWQRIKLETDENNNPTSLRGIVQDITAAKEKDLQIKSSNERFQLAMKATNELIWDWDTASDKVTRSEGYSTIFGYKTTRATSVQNFWFKKIYYEDRQRVMDNLFETLANKKATKWEIEYRFVKANGDITYVQDSGYIIRDKNQKAIRVVGAVKDITASKRLLREITKQNKILKDIAWIQSHKVRAPLAKIMSLIDILKDESYTNSDISIQDLYTFITEAALELDDVIREVIGKTETINHQNYSE